MPFEIRPLPGVVVLEGSGVALSDTGWEDTLYRTNPPVAQPCRMRAIPYYTGPMTVWLREQPGVLDLAAR
jgi:DUF1680 family protein